MKILIGMSGGLDSTYAAHLLINGGHEVEGACLVMHDCADTAAAEASCAALGIKLNILDCREPFERLVVRRFIDEYAAGHTPNPCVDCNVGVKIASLCDYAAARGFDRIATGHYAAVSFSPETGRYFVVRAACVKKDQSYMLWRLTQRQLSMLLTPLAALTKDEVRAAARAAGFTAAADAPESQEICFIPDDDHAAFVEARLGVSPPGDFIDGDGKIVGRHRGIIRYTIGQRKRLGIALGEPVYVSRIDPEANTVTVLPAREPDIWSMRVSALNFQSVPPCAEGKIEGLRVKIRYAAQPVAATVAFDEFGADVRFASPAAYVTPGQSAVFYHGDSLAFGGYIER